MALSPKEMHDRIIANLEEKTGYAFGHWRGIVDEERAGRDDKALINHIKGEHGLGHYTAVAIVKESLTGNDYADEKDLVATLFDGKPESMRLYKEIDGRVMGMPGVERVPCKTYVGYRTKTQFLIVAPTTNDGLRCGVSLSSEHLGLEPAAGFGSARIKSRFDVMSSGSTEHQLSLIDVAYKENV